MENPTTLVHRLWRTTTVDPNTGCWLWTGPLDRNGYGKITVEGRTLSVHRAGFIAIGRPFDPDLSLDHLCRNRCCWNPAHIEAVTIRENIIRGVGPTAINARKTECINGHPLTPDNLRRRPGARSHHRECRTCHRDRKRAARAAVRR